jgi:hypothetical protein
LSTSSTGCLLQHYSNKSIWFVFEFWLRVCNTSASSPLHHPQLNNRPPSPHWLDAPHYMVWFMVQTLPEPEPDPPNAFSKVRSKFNRIDEPDLKSGLGFLKFRK